MKRNKVNVINDYTVTIEKVENGSSIVLTWFDSFVVIASMTRYNVNEPLVLYVGKHPDDRAVQNRFEQLLFDMLKEPDDSPYFGEPNINYHFKNGYPLSDEDKSYVRERIVEIVDTCRGKYCTFQGHKFYKREDGLYTCLDNFKLDWDKAQQDVQDMGTFTLCTYIRGGIECPFSVAMGVNGRRSMSKFENEFPIFNIHTYNIRNGVRL